MAVSPYNNVDTANEIIFRQLQLGLLTTVLGKRFVQYVPLIKYLGFQKVYPQALGILANDTRCPNGVTPSHFGNENVVTGFFGGNRPFVAVRMELLDQRKRKITEVVEIIFKQHGSFFDSRDQWESTRKATGENGVFCNPAFYTPGGTTDRQLKAFGDILNGNTIQHPNKQLYLRLAPKKG